MRPVGLYVHIPYCLSKCGYCSFCSQVPVHGDLERYGRVLLAEMEMRLPGTTVSTLYAGGGTPTLMPQGFWGGFMNRLRSVADLSGLRETTIETNPGAVGKSDLAELRAAGFHRLSIGAQSFLRSELEVLSRRHTPERTESTFRAARSAGFSSIGLDLIYGIPGQTMESWRQSLTSTLSLSPEHISCYQLTPEDGTPLHCLVNGCRLSLPPENLSAEMYMDADRLLSEAGYLHYEVSNYSRGTGEFSRHNSAYWNRTPYIGLGPSAHSFDGDRIRRWNTPDTTSYLAALEGGSLPEWGQEQLTPEDIAMEMVMLGLRRTAGVDLEAVASCGIELNAGYLSGMVSDGKALIDGSRLLPTPLGMLFADGDAVGLLKADP